MSISRLGRRAAGVALALALAFATGATAAESGSRYGAVMATRIDLQRQLGEWLTKSLAGPAEPYRVEAAVLLEMRGVMREMRQKQHTSTPGVKIGGKNRVKLPGLGMVEGGGGQTNLMPEINIEGESRVSETVSRQLETEVERVKVILFVDPVMPKDRRDSLSRFAGELAGLDRARGDELVIEERPAPPPGQPIATQQPARVPWEVVAFCLTALVAAAILAFGLSRGAAAERSAVAAGAKGEGHVDAGALDAAAPAAAEAEERRKRREELGAFKVLADATPRELVQVMAEADPHTASAIADLVGFDADTAKLVETLLPAQRRIEIGLGLATSRVLTREQLAQLEGVAGQVLQRVRNRVALGSPGKLAEFLSLAPDNVRREVLEGVAARDQSLAAAARQAMVLFEDIPRLADASIKQIFAAIDPSTAAVSFIGAPDVRERVHGAVSKRLRAILEAEEEVAQSRPDAEVEAARHVVEGAMRQLSGRGELQMQGEAQAA